jgi:hypothetical protein
MAMSETKSPGHPNRDLDPNGTENVPDGTPADEGYMLAPQSTGLSKNPVEKTLENADEGYALAPPRKQGGPQQPPSYIWNSTTQELIPILPEDHQDHRKNREILIEATTRWAKGK